MRGFGAVGCGGGDERVRCGGVWRRKREGSVWWGVVEETRGFGAVGCGGGDERVRPVRGSSHVAMDDVLRMQMLYDVAKPVGDELALVALQFSPLEIVGEGSLAVLEDNAVRLVVLPRHVYMCTCVHVHMCVHVYM